MTTKESREVRTEAIRRAYDQERAAFEVAFPGALWESLHPDLVRELVESALVRMGYEVMA